MELKEKYVKALGEFEEMMREYYTTHCLERSNIKEKIAKKHRITTAELNVAIHFRDFTTEDGLIGTLRKKNLKRLKDLDMIRGND